MRLAWIMGLVAALAGSARAGVVINEVVYHPPDGWEDVQWVELHNPSDQPVDLAGWKLARGTTFAFPPGTKLDPDGYIVVALNPDHFKRVYGVAALGPMNGALARHGARIELLDAAGKRVDLAQFKDRAPWPLAAAGYSASIERISPAAPGDVPENWASSPMPKDAPKPSGTPGKKNAAYSATLPPMIAVKGALEDVLTDQEIKIEATVADTEAIKSVSLLYRPVTAGIEGKETSIEMNKEAAGKYVASIPGQKAGVLVRYRVRAINDQGAQRLFPAENELRPAFSTYVHDKWELAKVAFVMVLHARPAAAEGAQARRGNWLLNLGGGAAAAAGELAARPKFGSAQPRPPRGSSAFIYVDPRTGKTSVFDFVNIPRRDNDRGFKVHFHRDHLLNQMSVVSVIYEGSERFLLDEMLAYEVYRRAGNAASWSDFCRLWVDGRMVGYHLMIENPNRSFLRRNGIRDDGDLFKLLWFGNGVVGQHEKKTNESTGHKALLELIAKLGRTQGDEQWKVIQENFDVNQVATYFAVNMVLSHWDGFFNNHFVYDDVYGTRKWTMYPWDQDKTWGYHDGLSETDFFYDMPLTFGMNGDRPPGGQFGGPFGGGGAPWWRGPGHFSGPLLANPQFRKVFLQRVRDILETVYTKEAFFPKMDQVHDELIEDVKLRAKINGERPEDGVRRLDANMKALKSHLEKRREFLLKQPELAKVTPSGK
jgi:hypothetical protein